MSPGAQGSVGNASPTTDRGLSESTGVAVLVGFTVLVTASIGIGVLFFQEESGTVQANFSFSYFGETSRLLITMDEGEGIRSGDLIVSGPQKNKTWASLAGHESNRTVSKGAAVQVSRSSFGSPVLQSETYRIVYAPSAGNETVLSTWRGGG